MNARAGARLTATAVAVAIAAIISTAAVPHDPPAVVTRADSLAGVLDTMAPSALRYAEAQLRRTADALDPLDGYPRVTGPDGAWRTTSARDWTSGFFPGELWYAYQLTGDPYWRAKAEAWTSGIEPAKTMTTTHDLGFMIFDSFGAEYRLTRNEHARQVVLDASRSLATRFNPRVGAIKSWDVERARDRRATWRYPVIVDNLMNLEMLFWAGAHGGDTAWRGMAERHAVKSLHAHLRVDGSTAHVALFDPRTGALLGTTTWQGYSDSSVWARGQAWAMYGFGTAYRETGRPDMLAGARRAADWFLAHVPADGVPYWDFRDPAIPNAPRDASAAAIAASALLQLAGAKGLLPADAVRYRAGAARILVSLCSHYLTRGTAMQSIVRHAVGGKPQGVEIDVGLVYADYYLIEALMRWQGIDVRGGNVAADGADAAGAARQGEPIALWPGAAPGAAGTTPADTPTITPFIAAHPNGTAAVIFPGGGYEHLATEKEGNAVARWLASYGVDGFVVKYRLGPRYHHPATLDDGARAVRFVRANASRWGIHPARIGVVGFSAGGHLASTVGTHVRPADAGARDPIGRVSSRPDFMVLVYPVITLRDPLAHVGSRHNLLGPDSSAATMRLLSNELQVTSRTPPTFLVATTDDRTVPVENSLLFYDALRAARVPVELHIYETGPHGFGPDPADPILATWKDRCVDWMRRHGWIGER